ncbi:MAG: hypothetical protein WBD31_32565, partial [Rubripirellula sp.]
MIFAESAPSAESCGAPLVALGFLSQSGKMLDSAISEFSFPTVFSRWPSPRLARWVIVTCLWLPLLVGCQSESKPTTKTGAAKKSRPEISRSNDGSRKETVAADGLVKP